MDEPVTHEYQVWARRLIQAHDGLHVYGPYDLIAFYKTLDEARAIGGNEAKIVRVEVCGS